MRILRAEDTALMHEGMAVLLCTARHEVTPVASATEKPDLIINDAWIPPNMTDDSLSTVHGLRTATTFLR